MAAANTDLLRKTKNKFTTTVAAPGIDDNDTTIPLSSASGLPTDTAVEITMDRVDSNGTATPDKYESAIGVVSGNNLINVVRETEGTAQAHAAGAVVEVIWTANAINDIVDWALVEHNQDGSHKKIALDEMAAPSTPASGKGIIYFGTDSRPHAKTDGGFDALLLNETGWVESTYSLVYVSASSVKVSGVDVTSVLRRGVKLRFKQGGSYKNFVIKSSAFSTDTTINLTDAIDGATTTVANAAITDVWVSFALNPEGFPTGASGLGFVGFDGWTNDEHEVWTYQSVDDPTGVIDITGDVRYKYSEGMRISFVNGGNTIFGIITNVNQTLQSGNTRVSFLHEIDPTDSQALYLMANSAITVMKHSSLKAPKGFPLNPAKWSVLVSDTADRNQATPTQNTWYNTGSNTISLPIGLWEVSIQGTIGADYGSTSGQKSVTVQATLSTANNSESDADFTCFGYGTFLTSSSAISFYVPFSKRKCLAITSKTSYYLNIRTISASLANIGLTGAEAKTLIMARSTLL